MTELEYALAVGKITKEECEREIRAEETGCCGCEGCGFDCGCMCS